MSLEKQLASIKTKAEIHAWVDEQPDGVEGLILIRIRTEDQEIVRYRHLGDITIESSADLATGYMAALRVP